jgi:sulfur-oxidizing protein SoxY
MARTLTRRQTLAGLALGCAAGGRAFAQAVDEPDSWPELKHIFFNDAPIQEDKGLVSFEAPVRAEDAAIVPMSFSAKLPEGDTRRVAKLTLVIDENPVPLAAAFTLGEKAGDTRISTRVRVNSYSNTRVVAELSDGSLHMATRYIKASGGCSAPMVKSMDEALATLGQMKFRILPPTPEAPNEGLLMVRHPNNSGLQMDQVTRLYTPARYIAKLAVYGRGHIDLRGPELPLHLQAERRQAISRGSRGHGRQDLLRRMARDPRRGLGLEHVAVGWNRHREEATGRRETPVFRRAMATRRSRMP